MEPTVERLEAEARNGPIPAHVAIIMDGNGRWALARGLPRLAGHKEGAESVRAVTRSARRLGVRALTLYAFSAQNWARPEAEVAGLMSLLRDYLLGERDELLDNDIRLAAVGDLDRLPEHVRAPLDTLIADTEGGDEMVLTLCLSYGGREELVEAARRLAVDVAAGRVDPDAVDADAVAARLWTADLPEPDLVIRTSGEQRLSNFLLWGAAYAELVFTRTAWPDFREAELVDAIRAYQNRERRFGRVGEPRPGPDGL